MRREDPAWVLRVWTRLRREPSMLVTVAYLAVSFLGLWASYWFYRGFGLPILDCMQPSDYLVAGLRDPVYALLMLGSIAAALLLSWGTRSGSGIPIAWPVTRSPAERSGLPACRRCCVSSRVPVRAARGRTMATPDIGASR